MQIGQTAHFHAGDGEFRSGLVTHVDGEKGTYLVKQQGGGADDGDVSEVLGNGLRLSHSELVGVRFHETGVVRRAPLDGDDPRATREFYDTPGDQEGGHSAYDDDGEKKKKKKKDKKDKDGDGDEKDADDGEKKKKKKDKKERKAEARYEDEEEEDEDDGGKKKKKKDKKRRDEDYENDAEDAGASRKSARRSRKSARAEAEDEGRAQP